MVYAKAISLVWVSALSLAGCDGSQAPPVITRTDSGDNLAWAEGERFELVIATSAGDPIRILRKPEPRAPVTSQVRAPEVHADALGYIWIPRYHFGGRSASEWEVFDSTGVWVGPVPTPEDFDVHQIGAPEIIGVRRGECDVPYVQVYGLRRE